MPKQDASEVLMLKLRPLLKEWQKRLQLDHWKITLELDDDLDCWGKCSASLSLNEATIVVRNPDTVPSDWSGDPRIECTLVHELLHVRNKAFEPVVHTYGESKDRYKQLISEHYESSVDTTAKALVAAKYGLPK